MKALWEVLKGIRDDVDFENESDLMKSGILSSIDLISIIAALEEEYDIEIPATEINVDNFGSLESIGSMVRRLGATV